MTSWLSSACRADIPHAALPPLPVVSISHPFFYTWGGGAEGWGEGIQEVSTSRQLDYTLQSLVLVTAINMAQSWRQTHAIPPTSRWRLSEGRAATGQRLQVHYIYELFSH